jgi:peroxiredoxin
VVQLRLLTEFEKELAVSYCKVVAISVDPPEQNAAFRTGLGATFPILSDAEHKAQEELGLHDPTAPQKRPLLPCDFVLYPDLTIYKIYNGYWYVGRAHPDELRADFREVSRRIRPDWDPIGIESKSSSVVR